jgi:Sec-independent protein translocase protein TatA
MVDVSALALGALVIVVLIYLRPKTVTDVAHSLGKAASEFRRGQSENESTQPPSEDLKRVAQELGISVEGKSAQQLTDMIVAKTQRGK